jgi:WD40 repeat protein
MRTSALAIAITFVLLSLAGLSAAELTQLGIERVMDTQAGVDPYDHYDFQSCLAWSPDGERIACTLWNGTVEVWFAGNDTLDMEINTSTQYANSLCWSPDGMRLATAGYNGTIEIWDSDNGTRLSNWTANGKNVYSIAWSPDGGRLVSGGTTAGIQVWDVVSGRPQNISGHYDAVMCVAWSPDGSMLASGSKDKEVWIWNTTNWTATVKLPPNDDWIREVGWSPNGSWLAFSNDCEKFQVINITTLATIGTSGIQEGRCAISWSPDGAWIAFGDYWSGGLWFYNPTAADWVPAGRPNIGIIVALGWSADGTHLASLSHNGLLRTWSRDSDGDGRADATDFLPGDPTQWADTDGDGHGDNYTGISGDAFPGDPTQWQDSDDDRYGDNQSGNNPDPAPLDPDVPVRRHNDLWDWSLDPEPLLLDIPILSFCCMISLMIAGILAGTYLLAWRMDIVDRKYLAAPGNKQKEKRQAGEPGNR